MAATCTVLCMAECMGLSLDNDTLDALWICLTFLCNVTVEDHQRTSFLSYLATNVSSDINASSYGNCTTESAYLLNTDMGFSVPIKGYISPVINLLTIINNSLVCIVSLKPHMRSPINAIIVLIALSDTLTVLVLLPVYIYFYAMERVHEWIPYKWCYAIDVLEVNFPYIFHMASIWLTTALAIQRYIVVCHPFKARTWCTIRNVSYATSAIYFFATSFQMPIFFENHYIETRRRSRLNPSVMVSACVRRWNPWFAANNVILLSIYYWIRIIFIKLIPCVSLAVLNTLLIFTMRKAMRRRIHVLRQNVTSESQQLKETNSTTIMLVAVVVLSLLVEFPVAVYMTLLVVNETLDVIMFPPEIWALLSLFLNLFILLSLPLKFLIYCGMCKQFRVTLRSLFTGDAKHKEEVTKNGEPQIMLKIYTVT